jgi:putative RNA 2'-phosphotransferase
MTLTEILEIDENYKQIAEYALSVTSFDRFDVFMSPKLHTNISKRMSWLLRHNISNLKHDSAMYVHLDLILAELNRDFDEIITLLQVQNVVHNCPKQRFQIMGNKIRAAQGHSNVVIDEESIFEEIHEAVPYVVHMKNKKALKSIRLTGLNKMERTHIHFADDESMLRKGQLIKIKLNMQAAMDAGIKFYRATNDVILSPGNETGTIPFRYLTI